MSLGEVLPELSRATHVGTDSELQWLTARAPGQGSVLLVPQALQRARFPNIHDEKISKRVLARQGMGSSPDVLRH